MWSNLKNWHKSIILLASFFIIFYILGRLFVPLDLVDHPENYKWSPLIYSIFLILPLLIIKYSQREHLRTTAKIIIGIFLFVIIGPFIFLPFMGPELNGLWSEVYNSYLTASSGNYLIALFSLLYNIPLAGGFLFFLALVGMH